MTGGRVQRQPQCMPQQLHICFPVYLPCPLVVLLAQCLPMLRRMLRLALATLQGMPCRAVIDA